MAELHGVETIELMSGTVAVTTIPTAVIGLVGTAPGAAGGTKASGETGTPVLDNAVHFTAKDAGAAGNNLRVVILAPQAIGGKFTAAATAAVWDDGVLSITPAFDDTGTITGTADEVVSAVNGLAVAGVTAGGGGSGLMTADAVTLSGGEDEPFPLNTPVLIVGSGGAGRLGVTGTLPAAMADITDQTVPLVIVVRVAEAAAGNVQLSAVLAGIGALQHSRAVTGYQPRILLATGFSEDDAPAKALEAAAQKLRGVAYVDCAAGASLKEVILRRQSFGARVELLRPRVKVAMADGVVRFRPYSARAAGLRARIDMEKGWWWSKSNQDIYNILGVEQVDEFIPGEPNCEANLLNMQNVSTIVRRDGFKHWGNRLCISDPQWRFEAVRRTADVIEDSIQETVIQYADRPLDKQNTDDIIGTINAYIRSLVSLGAIFGGRAWLDEELNTAESLAAGWVYIDYDFGPKSPTERITLRTRVNKDYATGALSEQ